MSFNQELIVRITGYFRDRYGEYLTPEQAEEYLNSFADLFLAMAGIEDRPKE